MDVYKLKKLRMFVTTIIIMDVYKLKKTEDVSHDYRQVFYVTGLWLHEAFDDSSRRHASSISCHSCLADICELDVLVGGSVS